MRRSLLIGMGTVLAVAAALLIWQVRTGRRSADVPTQATPAEGTTVAAPAAAPAARAPSPIAPPVAPPAEQTPIRKLLGPGGPIPAGSAIATPPGKGPRTESGEEIIPPAPRDQVVVRDHRQEQAGPVPKRSFSRQGVDAAMAALKPALAPCAPSTTRVMLSFTLVSNGGRAQARDPRVAGAQKDVEAQQCVEKALATLSWATPDGDGSDPVTMPLDLR